MATLEELSEQAAGAAEQLVRDSIAMDYAYLTGNFAEWIEKKYDQTLGPQNVNSSGTAPGTVIGPSGGTDPAT